MLTQERLKELVYYNPETGTLHWKKTRGGAHAHKQVGSFHRNEKDWTSYLRAEIYGVRYFVHNLVWLYHTGELALEKLDHKDRDGLNNRFENLRKADKTQQAINRGRYTNNKSGTPGVYMQDGKWRAELKAYGKKYSLGLFWNKDAAIAARKAAERKYFGEFASA